MRNLNVYTWLIILGLSTLLLSCGGSSTGSTITLPSTMVNLSGIAADGPITGGIVTVTDATGVVVAQGKTDNTGAYHLAVPKKATLPLEVRVAGGLDLVSSQSQAFPLLTVVTQPISNITQVNANANVFTTIILTLAKAEAAAQSLPLNASILAKATSMVVANLNFGLDPAIDPIHTLVTATNTANISKANEALSEFVRRTASDKVHRDSAIGAAVAKVTNTTATAQVTNKANMQSVIAILAVDVSDGVLDGYVSNKAVLDAAVAASIKLGVTPPNAVEVQSLAFLAQINTVEVLTEVLTNRLRITNLTGAVVVDAPTTQMNLDKYAALSAGLLLGSATANQISVASVDASRSSKFLKKQIAVAVAMDKTSIANNDLYSASNKIQTSTLQGQQLDAIQTSTIRLIAAQLERNAGTLTQTQVDVYALSLRTQIDAYANAMSASRIDAITAAAVQLSGLKTQQKILAVSGFNATSAQILAVKNEAVLQVATVVVAKIMQNTVLARTKGSVSLLINNQITMQAAATVVQQIEAKGSLPQQAALLAAAANPATLNNTITLATNTAIIQDYDNLGVALPAIQMIAHVVGTVMKLNLPALNAGNAANLMAGKVQGKKQQVYLTMGSLPPVGSKGVATVKVIVKDDSSHGLSVTLGRLSGERYAQSSFVINWEVIQDALGNIRLLIVGAAGQASSTYISGSGGTIVQVTQTNAKASILGVSNVLQVTGQLDTKLVVSIASLFTSVAQSIPGLGNLRVMGDYFYWINVQGLPLRDMNGNLFTEMQGTMSFQ